jgi:hypothetical protein
MIMTLSSTSFEAISERSGGSEPHDVVDHRRVSAGSDLFPLLISHVVMRHLCGGGAGWSSRKFFARSWTVMHVVDEIEGL